MATKKKKTFDIFFSPTKKQLEVYQALTDSTTTEIYFTGGSGSGKSWLGCCWILIHCLYYPGIKALIGRKKLDDLKETTLATLLFILAEWNYTQYTYNKQNNIITFANGSEILLKQLGFEPQDPYYKNISGLELTMAFIDEVDQIEEKAKNILNTRIRNLKFKSNGVEGELKPKILCCCNPSKGWMYDIYTSYKNNNLPPYVKFFHSLLSDNPHAAVGYKEQMERQDEETKRRLFYADWDFEENYSLINNNAIQSLFNSKDIEDEKHQLYISCDVATTGKDKTIIFIWRGSTAIDLIEYQVNTIQELVERLKQLSSHYQVKHHNIIIDGGGLAGVSSFLPGSISFISQSTPLNKENFENLRCQCYYKLAALINSGKIKINLPQIDQKKKAAIIQELEFVRAKNVERDGKLQILSKGEIKKLISRSPDYADALMMFCWFLIETSNRATGEYFIKSTPLLRK